MELASEISRYYVGVAHSSLLYYASCTPGVIDVNVSFSSVLMYGGRILNQSKTLSDYKIMEGVTIFYMKKRGTHMYI